MAQRPPSAAPAPPTDDAHGPSSQDPPIFYPDEIKEKAARKAFLHGKLTEGSTNDEMTTWWREYKQLDKELAAAKAKHSKTRSSRRRNSKKKYKTKADDEDKDGGSDSDSEDEGKGPYAATDASDERAAFRRQRRAEQHRMDLFIENEERRLDAARAFAEAGMKRFAAVRSGKITVSEACKTLKEGGIRN